MCLQVTWRSDSKAARMGSNPEAGGPGMRLRERKDEAPPGQGSLYPGQSHATWMERSPAAPRGDGQEPATAWWGYDFAA